MKNITKAEEQILQHLWKLEKAYMKDLVEAFDEPRPAYTTVATLLTRMVEKEIVGFIPHGKVREYYPKIKKQAYFQTQFNKMLKEFFNDSTAQFASFFTSKADLSMDQLEELKQLIDSKIQEKKKK
jgi:BlaI family transcriptional regulator, penicillinase repressor